MSACSANHLVLNLITSYGEGAYRIFIFYFGTIQYRRCTTWAWKCQTARKLCLHVHAYTYEYLQTNERSRIRTLCKQRSPPLRSSFNYIKGIILCFVHVYISQVRSSTVYYVYSVTYVSTEHLFRPPRL